MSRVIVELLSKAHDRKSFDCGKSAKNDFLKQRARKHAELNFSKTWVAVEEGHSQTLGYVTLSMGNVLLENFTAELQARIPHYPIPVLQIGHLGTNISYHGLCVGSLLLRFAVEKTIEASETLGCFAIELIADNCMAFEWYLERGFTPRVPGSLRLYQSIETLRLAMGKSDV